MRDWIEDLAWSTKAFLDLVWPVLSKKLPGKLILVEGKTLAQAQGMRLPEDDPSSDLDRLAGIDAWHIERDRGIQGVGSRIQECPPPWAPYNTFTIRKSRTTGARTEYQKRKNAIKTGHLYPHLTVQGYITKKHDGELLSFAVAPTEGIISAIGEWLKLGQPDRMGIEVNRTGNASFYVVDWSPIAEIVYIAGEIEEIKAGTDEKKSQATTKETIKLDKLLHYLKEHNLVATNSRWPSYKTPELWCAINPKAEEQQSWHCPICKNTEFWQREDGKQMCSICYPPHR